MTSLPDGWIECPVGRLGKALGGLAFRPQDAKEEPASDLIACFRTSNIQQRLDQRDVLFIPRTLIRNEEQLLQEGYILISTANSDALVGKCVIVEGLQYPATLGGFISAFRVDPKYLNPRFFSSGFRRPLPKRVCARWLERPQT
jgi:type I restriction enzyme S subunit